MTSIRQTVVVQASSRSFGGGLDMCVNIAAGRPVVGWTMDRVRETFGDANLILAAPAFDAGGALPRLAATHGVTVVCAHDNSPLARLILAVKDLPDEAVIVRVDGLHFGFFPELARRLVATAQNGSYDLVKAPDDYPVQLTVDVYRVGALRRMAARADLEPIHHIHPKYFMLGHPEAFSCLRLSDPPRPDDAELMRLRHFAREVYAHPRLAVTGQAVPAGDQLTFHYELALPHIKPDWGVLDVACGPGYGARLLGTKARLVVAADFATEAMALVRAGDPDRPLVQADATRLGFRDKSFDAVISFETIEHVDDHPYLAEMHRVLKPGGLFVLSTPQNSLGHIPINAQHVREYSLEELTQTLSRHFEITHVVGIKQGRVVVAGDPLGQNSVIFCRKPAVVDDFAK
jgi:2-polyprenyl-3-methyl-5-hydroxy-6-metoxy-1,4-benzoquinol methylase/spore coat polysaccharide biosynthesis protein SpsF (cytidylyltransferase family)